MSVCVIMYGSYRVLKTVRVLDPPWLMSSCNHDEAAIRPISAVYFPEVNVVDSRLIFEEDGGQLGLFDI